MIGARALLAVLQFLSLPLLARLLDVRDFAIMALAMAIPLFANTFSDAGLGRSLVRRDHFDPAEWSTVFWFLAAVGTALGLLVIASAPVYSAVMGEPDLVAVVIVLASVPFLQALVSPHQAKLERDYRFHEISAISVASGVIALGVALAFALVGAGYWALVAQQVALAGARAAGFLWLSRFRPGLAFDWPLLKPHLNFGKNTLLFSGVMTAQSQVVILAFGQVFGTSAVALWSMAERASRLARTGLAGPVSQVTLVSMSRQWRQGDGAAEVADIYLASSRVLATVLVPAFVAVALSGDAIFVWFLSEPWRPVAWVFALAVPAFLVEALTSAGGRVFMVSDRTDLRLRMSVERFSLGLVVFLGAFPFGVGPAILARSVFAVLYLPRYWSYLRRCVPLDRMVAARLLVAPVMAGIGCGLVQRYGLNPLAGSSTFAAFSTLAMAVLAICAAGVFTRRELRSDIALLRRSAHRPGETGSP
nr:oligosaccharide flippase family protein [Marivita sp. GX14005]